MKLIKIPQILGYTKVTKKKINLKIRKDVKIPKGGLTWEQRVLRDEFDAEMRLKREKKKYDKYGNRRIPVRHEYQIGCVRTGFTFYKTLVWFT